MTTSPAPPAQAPPLDMAAAGQLPASEVLERLSTSADGLTSAAAADRLRTFGPNVLLTHRVTALGVLARQLRNPLLFLLLAAAAVSGLTGDPTDAAIIARDRRAERRARLRQRVPLASARSRRCTRNIRHEALVVARRRASSASTSRDLVPGDVVALRVGDVVPADLRLLEATQLECDEAVLTGESLPAAKSAAAGRRATRPLDLPVVRVHGHRRAPGVGRGVVVATGLGDGVRQDRGRARRAPGRDRVPGRAARLLASCSCGSPACSPSRSSSSTSRCSRPFIDALLFSLAIAIGITPQLLPAIVSVSLSTGSRALARRKVLVKRLVTIEDLGNIEVLFTDKTGTLTEGAITFDQALDAAGRRGDRRRCCSAWSATRRR